MQRIFLVIASLVFAPTAFAGSPAAPKSATTPDDLVALALLAEARGDSAARTDFLDQALTSAPDLPAAHWQSGRVWLDGAWVTPEQAAANLEKDLRLVEYRNVRDDYPDTIEGQLEIAAWCQRKGLRDQAQAHLTRVLDMNPGHVEARRELGHRWVEGTWLTPAEQAAGARRALQADQSLATWGPKLEKLRDALDRRNQRQREIAMERLQEIKDPLAIPALEAVLGPHNETSALALLDILAAIPGADSATALARQAVFSPSDYVRSEAAKKLQARPYHEFVPTLLAAMSGPLQSRYEIYASPQGRLSYFHEYYVEGADAHQVQLVRTDVEWTRPTPHYFSRLPTLQELISAQRRLTRIANENERQAQLNDQYSQQLTSNASAVLASVTNRVPDGNAKFWWEWWNDYNETSYATEKPVSSQYTSNTLDYVLQALPGERIRHSCLTAGTPVLTEQGAMSIESIKCGDRVLAQDPDSGELTFRPVLKTTHRDPVETLTLDAGEEGSLNCTGGHLFWVSGRGWLRARQLEPGMMLHTLDGPVELKSVGKGPTAEVFNLIVADFHDYFVAKGRWLSHDITPRAATQAVVPGLAKAQ